MTGQQTLDGHGLVDLFVRAALRFSRERLNLLKSWNLVFSGDGFELLDQHASHLTAGAVHSHQKHANTGPLLGGVQKTSELQTVPKLA